MTMQARHYMPAILAFSSFVFGAALLAYEHFNGGVQSNYLLDRPDLPLISNWYGLIVLPLLGWLLGVRLRNHPTLSTRLWLPKDIWAGLVCSLLYGAALATSCELAPFTITSALLLGMLLLAVALPIYRVECIFGFVVGMTFTFGAVLPALVAVVFAAVSVVARFAFRAVMSAIRRPNQPPGVA
ncbi:MAG TPA: hypothetical protein VN039_14500 [Nitrospira sp.]|nr:hypothetical protein [Nitrospira sp.]